MRLNSKVIAVVLVAVLFGGIGISKALGVWRTESSRIPAKYTNGEFAGQYNPEDIRGSFALQDISNAFEVPVETLAQAFGITVSDPASFQVKDLGTLYADLEAQGTSIETASVQHFVALYKGLPYTVTEETYFPQRAVELLKETGNLTAEQLDYLEKHSVKVAQGESSKGESTGTMSSNVENSEAVKISNSPESSEELDRTIKGKTTFKEVLDWGVSQAEIEAILGGKVPGTGLTIRDYCDQQGIEFSTVKSALQEKIDAQ